MESPGNDESRNLSRDNLSREIGRTCLCPDEQDLPPATGMINSTFLLLLFDYMLYHVVWFGMSNSTC